MNRYPVKIMATVTIVTKAAINSFFNTFFRIIISGRDKAVTPIRIVNHKPF